MPNAIVSLRGTDGTGILLFETLGPPLPSATLDVLLAYLDAATFGPPITRIDRIDLQHGCQLWDVYTTGGPAQRRVQESADVRFLSETRFSVNDADGNVYEIADLTALDERSRRELSRVI